MAALLCCAAAGVTVHQLTPTPTALRTVLAANRDLPAGAALDSSSLVPLKALPESLPAGSFSSVEQLTGKQIGGPVRKGQIITDASLLDNGLLTGTPPGTVAVPLRLADPASAPLVRPGQAVNVMLSSGDGLERQQSTELLAGAVTVVWTSSGGQAQSDWLSAKDADGLLVVAASPDQAQRLAGAQTRGKVSVVLVRTPERQS